MSEFGIESYQSDKHNGHEIHTIGLRLFIIKFRLHYAIAAKRLIVSTKRDVLQDVLDVLTRKGPPLEAAPVANIHVDIRPKAYDKLVTSATAGWQERMRNACLSNLVPVRELVENHQADPAALAAIARRIHGEVPRCPSGGTYKYDAKGRTPHCSVHGNHAHPRQPVKPTGREGIIRLLRKLQAVTVSFRFTKEGIMTKAVMDMTAKKE